MDRKKSLPLGATKVESDWRGPSMGGVVNKHNFVFCGVDG